MQHNDFNLDESKYYQLDELSKSNINAQDRRNNMMENVVRKSGYMFSFVNDAKIKNVTEMLIDRGIGLHQTNLAFKRIIEEYDKFPSFKEILSICRSYSKRKEYKEDNTTEKEAIKLAEIKQEFYDLLGKDKLESFVLWWLKEVYNLKPEFVKEFGFNPLIFAKPALFDWKETGVTNNFQRIADTGLKKEEALKKLRN